MAQSVSVPGSVHGRRFSRAALRNAGISKRADFAARSECWFCLKTTGRDERIRTSDPHTPGVAEQSFTQFCVALRRCIKP